MSNVGDAWSWYIYPNTSTTMGSFTYTGTAVTTYPILASQVIEKEEAPEDTLNAIIDMIHDVTKVMRRLNDEVDVLIAGEWDPSYIERSIRDMKAGAYDKIADILDSSRDTET